MLPRKSVSPVLFGLALALPVMFCACTSQKPPEPPPRTTPAQSRPPLQNLHQGGPKMDLLAQVDPQRDAVRGTFERQGDSLRIPAMQAAQLNLGVDIPLQYTLELEVARLAGTGSLNLGFPVGGQPVALVLGGWQNQVNALNRVDGRLGEDNITTNRTVVFPDQKPRAVRIIVRRDSVLVDIDNGGIIDFRGSPSRLSFDDRFFSRPGPQQLMLGSWDAEFRVSRWTLTPLSETRVAIPEPHGSPTTPSVTQANPPRQPAAGAVPEPGQTPGRQDPAIPLPTPSSPGRGDATSTPQTTEAAVKTVAWTAVADPFPGWDGTSQATLSVALEDEPIILPFGPSPYFGVGRKQEGEIAWTVFDLRTGSPVGTPCELATGEFDSPQLDPAGQYLRTYGQEGNERRVAVHSIASGQPVFEARTDNVSRRDQPLDFVIPGERLIRLQASRGRLQLACIRLPAGTELSMVEIDRRRDQLDAIHFSPGGRYAVLQFDNELRIYELAEGNLAGQLRAPADLVLGEALAFSCDGLQLAMVLYHPHGDHPWLWCVNWNSGQTALLSNVGADLKPLQNNYTGGPPLDWFPGNEHLLFYGRDVLDRRSGKLCYRLPETPFWQLPRRPQSPEQTLTVMPTENPGQQLFQSVPLDRAALDRGLAVVRQGGLAEDIELPPLRAPSLETASRLELPTAAVPLRLKAEPRPEFPAAEVKLPIRLARFQESDTALRRIELADAPATAAVAHFTRGTNDPKNRQDLLVHYDLASGHSTGSIPIHPDFELCTVSPSGNRAVIGRVTDVGSFTRLDVIDLPSKQHLAGWRPYRNEPFAEDVGSTGQPAPRNPQTACWVAMIDEAHVVTINPAGNLICWKLPEVQAVFQCQDFGVPLALSPDRRFLAGTRDRVFHLLDLQQRKWGGAHSFSPPPQAVERAGFSADRGELAAVLTYPGRREVVVLDLQQGKQTEPFSIPFFLVSAPSALQQRELYRRPGLRARAAGFWALDGLYLLDGTARNAPWEFRPRKGRWAENSPDNRQWLTEFKTVNSAQGQSFEYWLTAAELPSAEVRRLIASAVSGPLERPIGQSVLSTEQESAQLKPAPAESADR